MGYMFRAVSKGRSPCGVKGHIDPSLTLHAEILCELYKEMHLMQLALLLFYLSHCCFKFLSHCCFKFLSHTARPQSASSCNMARTSVAARCPLPSPSPPSGTSSSTCSTSAQLSSKTPSAPSSSERRTRRSGGPWRTQGQG